MNQQFHSRCISKKVKNTNSGRYMHPSIHSSIICNCQGKEELSVHKQMSG